MSIEVGWVVLAIFDFVNDIWMQWFIETKHDLRFLFWAAFVLDSFPFKVYKCMQKKLSCKSMFSKMNYFAIQNQTICGLFVLLVSMIYMKLKWVVDFEMLSMNCMIFWIEIVP